MGGAEWYVYNISKRLVKLGHEVHVFTAEKYMESKAPQTEEIEGIVVHRLPFKLDLSYRMKIWNGLRDAISKEGGFDIIHTYDYAQSHTRTALKVAKEQKTPAVITVFDVHSMIPRPFFKQIPIKIFERFFAKRTLQSASKLLVRAPTLIDSLEKLGVPEENIIVTPSGINEDSLATFQGEAFLREHQILGKPVVLFLGRLNHLKGPQQILSIAPEILKEFPNSAFVFVGPDQGGYLDVLRNMARSRKLESNVFFTGPIYDFSKKMEAYASCDVFVLPTSYEGTSQAIFEAMSQAKPVVSTSVGGIPYQITYGENGLLVPYGDDEALRTAVTSLLRDKVLSEKLGRNARDRVKSLTYPELVSKLMEIYESTIRLYKLKTSSPIGNEKISLSKN